MTEIGSNLEGTQRRGVALIAGVPRPIANARVDVAVEGGRELVLA